MEPKIYLAKLSIFSQEAELLSRIHGLVLAFLFFIIGLSAGMPDDRIIPAEDVLEVIKSGKPAEFKNCTIEGDLNLKGMTIELPVYFDQAVFRDSVDFASTIFNGDVHFGHSEFHKDANFMRSKFNGHAYFGDSEFKDNANFIFSEFNGHASFMLSEFNGSAYFWGSKFNGDAGFINDRFYRDTYFSDVVFNKDASFNGSLFKEDLIFENATFHRKLSLTRTRYEELFVRWHNIAGHLVYDDAAYMSLMKNFNGLGYFEDHDSCYFQYRKEHRAEPWPAANAGEEWLRKLIDYPLEWFYGYGTKPFNALLFSIAIVLVYALFWWRQGLGGPNDMTPSVLPGGEEWIDNDILDILGFSFTVFLSGTRLFIDPPLLPLIQGRSRFWTKWAFIFERLLGALFSILLFIAICGTIVRSS